MPISLEKNEYPSIQKLAEKEKATIYFGDESTIRSDCHSGTTWAPKGQLPSLKQLRPDTL